MDELEKGLSIALKGKEHEEALAACMQHMQVWGIALPQVIPLALDFGLGCFAKTGLIEYWICNEAEAGYCGKYLFVFDGQTCPQHRHARKHETFFIVKGHVSMQYDDTEYSMDEGTTLAVPPGRWHSFTGDGPALLLELSMPCEIDDNFFENPSIPFGANNQKGFA